MLIFHPLVPALSLTPVVQTPPHDGRLMAHCDTLRMTGVQQSKLFNKKSIDILPANGQRANSKRRRCECLVTASSGHALPGAANVNSHAAAWELASPSER